MKQSQIESDPIEYFINSESVEFKFCYLDAQTPTAEELVNSTYNKEVKQ